MVKTNKSTPFNVLTDLISVIKGYGIKLDITEAKWLGNKYGQTISLWAAISNRHGNIIAHIICLGLFLVQWKHCTDQLVHIPMQTSNYIRALVLLCFLAPIAFIIGCIRWVVNK